MIPEFTIQLVCGLSTVWCIAPRSEITSGFFRIQMLLTLGLGVLFILTSSQLQVESTDSMIARGVIACAGFGIAGLSFAGSVAWTLERRKGGAIFAGLVALVSTYVLVLLADNSEQTSLAHFGTFLEKLSAAWLIGSVTAAMLLGHWYLTATGMPLAPFVKFNYIFLVAVILRIATELFAYTTLEAGVGASWGLLVLRWAGLIGPLIVAFLSIRILRYKNTQSATGVLYAATTLVFMGEMAASLIEQARLVASTV